MRRFSILLCLGLVLGPASTTSAQLNGSYTVGPAGNYANIAAAITALQTSGVSGPVTMNIISGSYSGNWTINAIAGTSAVNTVTFRSQAMNAAAVTLSNAGASAMLTLSNCTFVRLQYVTATTTNYGVLLQNAASDITISECMFSAGTWAGINSSAVFTGSRITVENNSFVGGQFAVRLNNSGVSYGADMVVRNNTITGVTSDGLIVERADGLIVEGNTISSAGATTATYDDGIFIRNCINELLVARNTVNWGIGTNCIHLSQHTLLPAQPPVIENNMLVLSGANAAGCVLSVDNAHGTIVRHNSMRSTINRYTLQVQFCNNVIALGNIHQTMAVECLMTQSATFNSIDRNIYYCTQANVIRWAVSTYYTWSAWQAQGWDASSLFIDPLFVSATDLHLQAGSPAISLAPSPAVTAVDRDGGARPLPVGSTPDIGAHERPDGCTGMSGTYTIGPGVGNDFASFNHAVLAMSSCTLIGPVLFLVQSGTYTEQVSIPQISGTSATNTITFRSAALDSSVVVLTWPSSTTAANNFTVRMNGGDFVTWDRITIDRTGTSNYAQVVVFNSTAGSAGSQSTRITRCRLRGTTATVTFGELLYAAANGNEDSVRVERTRFENGTYGFRWGTTADNDLLLVQDNVLIGQSVFALGLTVRDRSFTLRRNTVQTSAFGSNCISIAASYAGFNVHDNRLESSSGTPTVIITTVNTSVGGEPRFYNNTVLSWSTGIQVAGPVSNLRVDHNSIFASTYGIHFVSGVIGLASFRNNAIYSGNYTVYRQSATTTLTLSSNNALFRGLAGPLAFWTAAQNTLPALQAASGGFASSVNADPRYYDAFTNDLHAYAMEADMAATPIAYITTDIDGQPRSLTTPDIGADEFTPQLWAEAFNTCGAADAITSTGSGTDQWIYKDRKVLARFNDNGQILGTVQLNVFLNNGPVRTSDLGQHYLDRNWHLVTQNAIASSASIRLFFSGSEFTPYAAADPLVATLSDAGVAHYAGVNENCLETDDPAGQQWTSLYPISNGTEARINATGGTNYVTPSIGNDGELYVTGLGQVLPVELLAFTAKRANDLEVQLDWTTATEHDNAGFEVWRMIEGEEDFTRVGWVNGAGNSLQLLTYASLDDNASAEISYYKLKQVDTGGQYEWSLAVAVEGAGHAAQFMAHPNPARDVITLRGLPENTTMIAMHDASGRLVKQWSSTAMLMELGELERGVYVLVASDPEGGGVSARVVLD